MMDTTGIQTLGEVSLAIPAWQMGLFVALVSLFMLLGRTQLGLIVTYLFVLYWGFILYWPDFVAAAEGNVVALAIYVVCGLTIVFFALLAFTHPPSKG